MNHPALSIQTFAVAVMLLAGVSAVMAQAPAAPVSPSTEQMIEQLRSPRTRSLRNLQVEAVQPTAANATASSVTSASPATPAQASANTPAAVAAVTAPAEPKPQLSLLIQFDFDSARVRAESLPALDNLALALKSDDLRAARFAIEGHTDAKGRADYNQRLSQLRAEAVRDYLASLGVQQDRLLASGKGSSEPANRADRLAAENRRVRIVNLD
jgi:OmpA-OmpF porin, OOP family